MLDVFRYGYTQVLNPVGEESFRPLLPVTLINERRQIETVALLDTGSDLKVLPFSLGLQLGLEWEKLRFQFKLGGILADYDSRAVLVTGVIGNFSPVPLAFAWTTADHIRPIFGHTNFFSQFDVCFFGSELTFEVRAKPNADDT